MMAKESAASRGQNASLDALSAAASAVQAGSTQPPVHLWDPPFCGDIDMRIMADGTWLYGGTPIGRPAMVRLFASILRVDPEGTMLVTPVEKVRIQVEDAAFLAVEMLATEGALPVLRFRTNVDEWVEAGPQHRLTFRPGAADGLKPYIEVRRGLYALVKRALFYDLVERGEVRTMDQTALFGVASAGLFFPMAPAAAVEEWL